MAVQDAKRACAATLYKRAALLDTLAAAYAEAGDFESTLRYEEQAIRVAKSSTEGTPKLLRELEEHHASFKMRRPWRKG